MTPREKVEVIDIEMCRPMAETGLELWKINLKPRIHNNKQKVVIASEPKTPKWPNQDKVVSLSIWSETPNYHVNGKMLVKNDK